MDITQIKAEAERAFRYRGFCPPPLSYRYFDRVKWIRHMWMLEERKNGYV